MFRILLPLSYPVEVRVHQSHIIITGDDIPQGGQALLDTLHLHRVWQAVANVLQLLVRGVVGHQKPVPVTYIHTARSLSL